MRSVIAAVAACLMFGAAQAATAVWSTADVNATSTTVTPSYGANTSHTIGLAFLLPAGGTNAVVGAGQQVNFPGGGGTSPNNNTLQVYFADGTATLKVQGNGTANTASFTLGENLEAGSRHGLVYSLQRGANEQTSTLSVYFDGVAIVTDVELNANFWSGPVNSIYAPDPTLVGEALAYDTILSADECVALTKTIPEPTALALLALGVAGVALRRRGA